MFDNLACGATEPSYRRHPPLAAPKRAEVVLASSQVLSGSDDETAKSERLLALGQAACLLGAMRLASEGAEGSLSLGSAPVQEHDNAAEDEVSPERLLATGYAACFLGALSAVASDGQGQAPERSVAATVTLDPRWAGEAQFAVALDVALPGLDRGTAEALLERAHGVCPYPHVSRDAVGVTLRAA